jgi:peptide/nickel transport system ATP-binding protein
MSTHSPLTTPGSEATGLPLLDVADLAISFGTGPRQTEVVRSTTLKVQRGMATGLVGESGSGKTVTSLAMMGLLGFKGGRITRGTIRFEGNDVTTAPESQWRQIRGKQIGMVFQQPMRSLNPSMTVGEQIAEVVRRHLHATHKQARTRAVELLDQVRVPNASERANDYPHQFSGGMCQRVSIAIAIACAPDVLIADEPTTALDVTVQAKILRLLRDIIAETDIGVLYISHDLAVVGTFCDNVTVMYAGESVESGTTDEVFRRPQHPYTAGLIHAIARPGITKVLRAIPGRVPPPNAMPAGCRFHPRCPHGVSGVCDEHPIDLTSLEHGRTVRCARHTQLELNGWTA